MYSIFDGRELEIINDKLSTLLVGGGIPLSQLDQTITNMRESEFYCFVSQAFMAIGIPPVFPKEFPRGKWNFMSNPFVALTGAEEELLFAKRVLNNNYGVNVEISTTIRMMSVQNQLKKDEQETIELIFSYTNLIMYSLNFYRLSSSGLFDIIEDVVVSDGYEANYYELFYFIYSIPIIQFALVWQKTKMDNSEIRDNINAYVNRAANTIKDMYYVNLSEADKDVFKSRLLQYEQPYISISAGFSDSELLFIASYNIFKSHETTEFIKKLWQKMDEKHSEFLRLLGTF